MKPSNYANRRFIRIQSIEDLYSFHIMRNANYELCMDAIKSKFIYNTLADPLVDKKSLDIQCKQALDSFKHLVLTKDDVNKYANSNPLIYSTVITAYYNYKSLVSTDFQNVKSSLDKLEIDVNHICLSIIQLLLEWRELGSKQKLCPISQQNKIQFFAKLNSNTILQKIAIDKNFQESIKKYSIDWKKNLYLVEDWVDSITLSPENIPQYNHASEESIFLEKLLKHAILKSTLVIDFFENKYLLWYKIHPLVKDTLLAILNFYATDLKSESRHLQICFFSIEKQTKEFHAKLLDILMEKEDEIESILDNRLKNWTLDRVVFLDKIIAKLAICEILQFIEIPRAVSINEYIDIAKLYGNEQSGKFINGILDAVQKKTLEEL